jgi:2-alkyl-3-oxoalkanoate reductase
MKVLVAGATGAIGRPVVSALMAARHEVIGMSSSEYGAQRLRDKGVEGAVANALDENAVLTLVRKVRPDAVIEELTSLPKRYTPEEMKAAADRDRTVRLVGGRNVQNAAQAAGTKRYVVQSTGFFYGPGPALAVEREALAVNASPTVAGSVQTYLKIEERVLGARGLHGVALRYGFFYGPGTYHDLVNGSVSEQVRAQAYPVIGSGRGVFSFVHVEDAAVATVAALEVGRLQHRGRQSLGDGRVAARICAVSRRAAASTHYRRRGASNRGGRCRLLCDAAAWRFKRQC